MEYNITVAGPGGVGKTSTVFRFVSNVFDDWWGMRCCVSHTPRIVWLLLDVLDDSYRKQVTIDDEICLLDIRDTAGQEEFVAMRDQTYRSSVGYGETCANHSKRTNFVPVWCVVCVCACWCVPCPVRAGLFSSMMSAIVPPLTKCLDFTKTFTG